MRATGEIRIGISGWRYPGWRGSFYPPGLQQREELRYASSRFRTIELNGSFYSLQRPESFQRWRNETPDDFVFAVKGSRFLTHMKKLKAVETGLANFFAQGLLALGAKLGPILWQFPPQSRLDCERFEAFFQMLPRTQQQAAAMARNHGPQLHGRAWLRVDQDQEIRHAVEIRHPSFVCERFIALLRKYNVASVVADAVDWPRLTDVTADFVYCRLHGDKQLYASGYGPRALDNWAERALCWARGGEHPQGVRGSAHKPAHRRTRDVFLYFDNDAKVRAPIDAHNLEKRIDAMQSREAAHRDREAA